MIVVLGHDSALVRHNLGVNEMNLLWIMALVQDRSLNLLTSSPARYHCSKDAPAVVNEYR